MRHSPRGRPSRLTRWLAPALLGVSIVALDLVQREGVQYAGVLVAVPLLAAVLGGPLATAGAGVVALALSYSIGLAEASRGAYDAPNGAVALARLGFIAAMTVIGVVASQVRTRSERDAGQVAAVADAAQLAILEPPPRVVGGLRCASAYRSSTQLARIGGDLVAVVETPQGVRALVGDVQGKGLEAVRLAGYVLGSFRERAHDGLGLTELAEALDRTVRRASLGQEVFVTAVLVQVDGATGQLEVLSCGHPAPFVVAPAPAGSSVRAEELPAEPGPPLGLLELVGTPEVLTHRLRPADRLVLVTDGVLEARRPRLLSREATGPFVDAEGLLGEHLGRGSMTAGLDGVVQGLTRWTRGRLRDDLAVLVLERPLGLPQERGPVAPSSGPAARSAPGSASEPSAGSAPSSR